MPGSLNKFEKSGKLCKREVFLQLRHLLLAWDCVSRAAACPAGSGRFERLCAVSIAFLNPCLIMFLKFVEW